MTKYTYGMAHALELLRRSNHSGCNHIIGSASVELVTVNMVVNREYGPGDYRAFRFCPDCGMQL